MGADCNEKEEIPAEPRGPLGNMKRIGFSCCFSGSSKKTRLGLFFSVSRSHFLATLLAAVTRYHRMNCDTHKSVLGYATSMSTMLGGAFGCTILSTS